MDELKDGDRVAWRSRAKDYTGTIVRTISRYTYALVLADNGKLYRVRQYKLRPIAATEREGSGDE